MDVATDVIAFLNARLDEDEAAAAATTPVPLAGQWKAVRDKHAGFGEPLALIQGDEQDDPHYEGYSSGLPVIVIAAEWQDEAEANLRHIARHDPARALREVTAKRAILDEHRLIRADGDLVGEDCCDACHETNWAGQRQGGYPCPTVRLLAGIYEEDRKP